MNHKITLWPSIAAVLIWLVPFFVSHCDRTFVSPEPILEFKLIEPGIPGVPDAPPIIPAPKIELFPDNKNLSWKLAA